MSYLPMDMFDDGRAYFTPVNERNRVNIIRHKCWVENGIAHVFILSKWLIANGSSYLDGIPKNERVYDASNAYVVYSGMPRPWDDIYTGSQSSYGMPAPIALSGSMLYRDPTTNRTVADWISTNVSPRGTATPNEGEISFMFPKVYDGTSKDYFLIVCGMYPVRES